MKNLLLGLTVLSVLGGCAISGRVTDVNNKTTAVSSMYVSDPGTLIVQDGSAMRELDLRQVKSIRIKTDMTRTIGRDLFYCTEIVCKDGTTIGSFDDKRPRAYIAGSSCLHGLANDSNYSIMINDVSKIEIDVK